MIKVTNVLNIKNNYKSLKMDFVFDSIIERNTLAEIYINNLEDPTVSIICEGHLIYLGGTSNDIKDYKEVVDYFRNSILDEERRSKLGVVRIIYSSEICKKALLDSLGDFDIHIYDRVLYNHSLKSIPSQLLTDKDIKILEIDKILLSKNLINTKSVVDEITLMWGSIENFSETGFGYCAIKGDMIIGWCTSEYMSKKACGIGIETAKDFQGQGVASSLTECLLNKCFKLNLIPHWDSWKQNIPSVKVAEKTGFKEIMNYKVLFIRF